MANTPEEDAQAAGIISLIVAVVLALASWHFYHAWDLAMIALLGGWLGTFILLATSDRR